MFTIRFIFKQLSKNVLSYTNTKIYPINIIIYTVSYSKKKKKKKKKQNRPNRAFIRLSFVHNRFSHVRAQAPSPPAGYFRPACPRQLDIYPPTRASATRANYRACKHRVGGVSRVLSAGSRPRQGEHVRLSIAL